MRKSPLPLLALLCIAVITNAQPVITSFTPQSAAPGMSITISGTGFTNVTSVTIGSVNATFTAVSQSQITATVPVTSSGTIAVTTTAGTGSRANFIYVPTSEIMTDFGGFWRTKAWDRNTTNPDDSHNLLGFTHNGITYSTGADNSKLTNNGITFTPATFKALPVAAIAGVAGSGLNYIALASKVDGSAGSAYVAGVSNYTIKQAMIDGVNGLDMGTGVTNLPSSALMTFQIYNIDASKASDAEPDLILTQTATPTSSNDVFTFVDAEGKTVGNSFTQDMTLLPSLGTYVLDLFTLPAGVPYNAARPYGVAADGTNTTRNIRLVSLNLSSFGINTSNASSVRALRISPSGNSDYAFIGYNTGSINLPPNAALSPETSVTNVCTGGTASLEVIGTPAAGGILSYTWEESTNNGTTWNVISNGGNYSGATTDRLSVANAVVGNRYRAAVQETDNGNAGISGVFTIAAASGTAPTSVTIAGGGNVCANISAQLTSTVVGGNGFMYQWQSNASGSYQNIPGANTAVYIPPTNSTGTTSYRLETSPGAGCPGVVSSARSVTVTGVSSTTPAQRCGNGTVMLNAAATSGGVSWYATETGGNVLGSTNSYTTESLAATTTYYVAAAGCSQRVPVIASISPVSAAGAVTTMVGSIPNTTVLTLSSQTGNVIKWQSSTDNFTSVINDIAYTQSQLEVTNPPQETQYRAVVQSGTCTPVNSLSSLNVILPIRTNSLKLSKLGTAILLQWETYNQERVVTYEIEKSIDGANFIHVGRVATNTSSKYKWQDETPGTGQVMYRVKEVSQDGNSVYSNTVSTVLKYKQLVIYPNPVRDNVIKVQLNNSMPGKYNIHIYNPNGAVVFNSSISHNGGSVAHSLALAHKLPAGVYSVVVIDPSGQRNTVALLVQ